MTISKSIIFYAILFIFNKLKMCPARPVRAFQQPSGCFCFALDSMKHF
nr:MAG TPA: hypothetical protein [Caudoviricetes sp.]